MEPKSYFDPPSEREWTIEEMEEFFAGQDARTGLFNGGYASNRPPVKEVGIHVTHITPPAAGWPIALYCPLCKETTFVLSPWAKKPDDGDYWKMKDICGSEVLADMHNFELSLQRKQLALLKYPISPKSIFGYDPTEDKP